MVCPPDATDETSTVHRAWSEASWSPPTDVWLVVLEGPDAPRELFLERMPGGRVLVGTSEACDVRLTDREVSRRHLAIDRQGTRIRIVDLESTNGTFVDGVGLLQGYVLDGQIVRIGSTAFRLEARTSTKGTDDSSL